MDNLPKPKEIVHELVQSNDFFPNNPRFPFLLYKLVLSDLAPESVQQLLKKNGWTNSWIDGIYDFHHFHSNTHEALVILEGNSTVQMGGPQGKRYQISKGDVLIIPAGVSHKSLTCSANFLCIGAYPFEAEYDMHYGKPEEHPTVDLNIKRINLPKKDPIFGNKGPLFIYWK